MRLSLIFVLIRSLIMVLLKSVILIFLVNGLYIFGHLELISLVLEGGCRLVFASILIIFSITLFYAFRSCF